MIAKTAPAGSIRAGLYPLFILTLAYTCHFIDRTVISIVIEPLKHEFDLNDSQIGFLSGLAYAIPFAIVGIPIGLLIDRINRRNLLATVLTIWSGFTILVGFARSYTMILVARMCVGMAEAGASPSALSMISDMFAPNRRATAVSLYYLSVAFGTGGSFIIGGVVAAHYGWRAAFWVAGVPGLLLALLMVLTMREPKRGAMDMAADTPPPPMGAGQAWRFARRQAALLHISVGMIISNLVLSSFLVWIASFLIREHGFDIKGAGLMVGIGAGLFGSIGSALGGSLADKLTRGRPARLALAPALVALCVGPITAAMVLSNGTTGAVVAMMVLAMFLNAHFGPAYSLVLSLSASPMRGVSMSALQVATNLLSFGFGPLLVGGLSDVIGGAHSLKYSILIVSMLSLWASLHYVLGSRSVDAGLARVSACHEGTLADG
ncbi:MULTISPECIES: spinster family MFS transporter [unclassified Sphingomonas]|uniref:spinster family MFS transporter n=1 Tax=unclassified Sphingomonas TaxID=196159 RepID=UPI0006F2EC66|nr:MULTISPECIES: MFS transporter [unclassified Sphingomonas]KQX23400.1 hypothetical protein ASD17_03605 [Sphingomonas sp. Root1294]KQY68251.1 hypothetical protein ASD39_06125 [Sphingomonas sp. Root50]KRB91148.1 hypothetical protein ASE22_12925 [Sphingomonas sp. Root720]